MENFYLLSLQTSESDEIFAFQVGLKLFGKEKPHHLKEIDIDLKSLHSHSQLMDAKATADDLNWEGAIELDIIIYPTMKGVVELNQVGETYGFQSKLTMPHGVAFLTDTFYFHVSNGSIFFQELVFYLVHLISEHFFNEKQFASHHSLPEFCNSYLQF